jgi:hypothetical protein
MDRGDKSEESEGAFRHGWEVQNREGVSVVGESFGGVI